MILPVDPVEFRDSCFALWDWCDQKKAAIGDDFKIDLAIPMFFMEYFDVKNGDETAYSMYERTSMRVFEFGKICNQHDVDFADVLGKSEATGDLEAHVALIEAMAVVPFRESGVDLADLLAEARSRAGEIDSLDRLFARK
jgi:hypothetical protein